MMMKPRKYQLLYRWLRSDHNDVPWLVLKQWIQTLPPDQDSWKKLLSQKIKERTL